LEHIYLPKTRYDMNEELSNHSIDKISMKTRFGCTWKFISVL